MTLRHSQHACPAMRPPSRSRHNQLSRACTLDAKTQHARILSFRKLGRNPTHHQVIHSALRIVERFFVIKVKKQIEHLPFLWEEDSAATARDLDDAEPFFGRSLLTRAFSDPCKENGKSGEHESPLIFSAERSHPCFSQPSLKIGTMKETKSSARRSHSSSEASGGRFSIRSLNSTYASTDLASPTSSKN